MSDLMRMDIAERKACLLTFFGFEIDILTFVDTVIVSCTWYFKIGFRYSGGTALWIADTDNLDRCRLFMDVCDLMSQIILIARVDCVFQRIATPRSVLLERINCLISQA